jgi:hypothetical protein
MYANMTLETVAIDTRNNMAVFVTDAPVKRTPIIIIIIIIIIIARALGVSGRVALLLLLWLPTVNIKNLYLVTPVFVCSVWLHGGQLGCLSIM